ncbi:MAG: hypothetical protein DI587_37405 [Variovorax paradoxus]|nr:MAG: hypothetical protein DI583_37405 [Variovorax paradoxus]PZQ00127.1 MAG: hypothetical protein DI587_37405 [Variovorax paradoxus]
MQQAELSGTTWQGQLRLGDRWACWRGVTGDGQLHRHFAAQAVIASGSVEVFDGRGGSALAECVLIDPLTPHRLVPGCEVTIVYVEPGRHIDPLAEEVLAPVRSARTLSAVSLPRQPGFWAAWLAAERTAPVPVGRQVDRRLAPALAFIEAALPAGAVSLSAAAATACLSGDRLRHLFVEQFGLPFRRYVLWRRLRLAASALMAGADVTAAAHEAGFADAAHLARTLKSTFGVTAGEALRSRIPGWEQARAT